MNYKEIFGDELGEKIEGLAKEKGLSLLVDNKEKPEYIPKSRFDEVIGSKNELKTQVSELANQLEELKKKAIGNDDFIKQIEELQGKNATWEKRYKDALLENAIKVKAISEKAIDANDLLKFLDTSALIIDESGVVSGLDEQIARLRETKSYLFNNKTSSAPPNPATSGDITKKQALIDEYNMAQKAGNVMKMFTLETQIRKLK